MNVCGKCGLTSVKKNIGFECKTCKTGQHIKEILIPYASKLLFQELMAMQIAPRLNVDEIKEFN
jgi:DNA-directed RNA polymerase beta subunit